jgi:hypothetical protein
MLDNLPRAKLLHQAMHSSRPFFAAAPSLNGFGGVTSILPPFVTAQSAGSTAIRATLEAALGPLVVAFETVIVRN